MSDRFTISAATGVEGLAHTLSLRIPNPIRGSPLLGFSLLSTEPAVLEVFDIVGRRVISREVGSIGPGTHTVAVGDLRPGVYLARLTQAGRSASSRMVVIR